MFKKILIANRGEIACRIAQTVQEMGIRAVAVYSEADGRAVHVPRADEAYGLDGFTPAETYLRGDKILDIARRHGVDAIHPGYGFLSENAVFAQACGDAGITFIGPTPDVIRAMGDKIIAKRTLLEAGVPVVPGWAGSGNAGIEVLREEAERIGFPVLIKAAAGGGGKGMRVVYKPEALSAAVESAQREAGSAFGDPRIFLEKYITRPRHVEFQIFGDAHGNVVHIFERECSIQRRHQKIVEESPSPALTQKLRAAMGAAAVRAAKAIGYTNAGTVEFIVDETGRYYFLEVNTRLQVEHPVTEFIARRDLVRAQILVAAGEPMPFRQEELTQTGHAMECRIYAEDAARGFLPSTGTIERFAPPFGPGIRVDSGVAQGSEVSVHYDPMLAKLVVWASNREHAIQRMAWALDHFVILGVTTNVEFLRNLVTHPAFVAGDLHTHFLEEHKIAAGETGPPPDEAWIIAAWTAAQNSRGAGDSGEAAGMVNDPWAQAGRWRGA